VPSALFTRLRDVARLAVRACAGVARGDDDGLEVFVRARETLIDDIAHDTTLDATALAGLIRAVLAVDGEVGDALEIAREQVREDLVRVGQRRRWLAYARPPAAAALIERDG
jgi:hypothetical protein